MVRLIQRRFDSPVGELLALICDGPDRTPALCLLEFHDRRALPRERQDLERHYGCPIDEAPATGAASDLLDTVERQLGEYFAGARTEFDLPLDLPGTPFQQSVWNELLAIPYGETTSYGALARKLGKPGGSRAVGMANGANRVAIVVPCHRVVESTGALRGYGGGIERKRFLLELEQGVSGNGTLWDGRENAVSGPRASTSP